MPTSQRLLESLVTRAQPALLIEVVLTHHKNQMVQAARSGTVLVAASILTHCLYQQARLIPMANSSRLLRSRSLVTPLRSDHICP